MRKIKTGMIGYGHWGKLLYRYFSKHEGFTITRIASRHPGEIAGSFPEDMILTTPDALLENQEIEAVVVATPIETHYHHVLEALKRGRHVFSEKPLTLTAQEAGCLAETASKMGVQLFTDYILTFSPAISKMIALAKEGAVGTVKGCCFHVRQLGRFAQNVYWDLGSHILSVLDLLTPLDQLTFKRSDIFKRDGIVETGQIAFRSKDPQSREFTGSILISMNHPMKERNMSIYGSEGSLIYDLAQDKVLSLTRYTVNRLDTRNPESKEQLSYEFDELNTIGHVVQRFYDIATGRTESNINMSRRVTGVLEKLTSSDAEVSI